MVVAVVGFVGAFPRRAAAQAPGPALSVDEIRKLHDAGQYRSALQEAARSLRGVSGAARFELQLIRGDSLLHLDDAPTALEAYAAASKSDDGAQLAESRGTALLIRRSSSLKYAPKKGGEPIDIVDHASRKRAAAALLADQLAADRKEIDAALSADNLKPIIAVVEPILDLRALEYIATGQATETGSLAQRVGERARDLISRELGRLNDQVNQYERIANQIQDDGGRGVTRRGLISTQRKDLRDLIGYLGQIRETAERARQLARIHGGPVDAWERVVQDTTAIQRHAADVLAAE
jgi:hypothetical protein